MRKVVSIEFNDNEAKLWEKLTRMKDKHYRTYQNEIKAIIERVEE